MRQQVKIKSFNSSIIKRFACVLVCAAVIIFPHAASAEDMIPITTAPPFSISKLSGMIPQPGLYKNDLWFFEDELPKALNDSLKKHKKNPASPFVNMNAMSFVSSTKLFGASVAMGGMVPETTSTTPLFFDEHAAENKAGSLQDVYLQPVILGWQKGNFHWMTTLAVYVPVGEEASTDDILNLSRQTFAISPNVAMTWYQPTNGYEVSANLLFDIHYGDDEGLQEDMSSKEVHMGYTVAKHFMSGWAVAFDGYVESEIKASEDENTIPGVPKTKSIGMGPGISYKGDINDKKVSLTGKYKKAINVEDETMDDAFWLSLSLEF